MAVPGNFSISPQDITSIDQYRKQKNTAVLTVMFTDLKGFTRLAEEKGDEYSAKLRESHDYILAATIQENNAGLIIKYIGDAVMAVFSEPSTAVERALEIQRRLRAYNAENPDTEDMEVRIGLHMGQVVMENQIQQDVFGRHVNRCSRIEGMADGGQIYMSYSVFDSAKGWLITQPQVSYKSHGHYFLKGIDEPVEIYEVKDKGYGDLLPPKSGKKKRSIPTLMVSAILVLLGAAITLGILQYKSTEVWVMRFYPEDLRIDGGERLILEGGQQDEKRLTATPVSTGKHVLWYDVSALVRYYAEIEVERGENYIQPKFKYVALPSLNRRYKLGKELRQEYNDNKTYNYYEFDKDQNRIEHEAVFDVNAVVTQDEANSEKVNFTVKWEITLDGKMISQDQITASHIKGEDLVRSPEAVLYEDAHHYYYHRYYLTYDTIDITLGSYYQRKN